MKWDKAVIKSKIGIAKCSMMIANEQYLVSINAKKECRIVNKNTGVTTNVERNNVIYNTAIGKLDFYPG